MSQISLPDITVQVKQENGIQDESYVVVNSENRPPFPEIFIIPETATFNKDLLTREACHTLSPLSMTSVMETSLNSEPRLNKQFLRSRDIPIMLSSGEESSSVESFPVSHGSSRRNLIDSVEESKKYLKSQLQVLISKCVNDSSVVSNIVRHFIETLGVDSISDLSFVEEEDLHDLSFLKPIQIRKLLLTLKETKDRLEKARSKSKESRITTGSFETGYAEQSSKSKRKRCANEELPSNNELQNIDKIQPEVVVVPVDPAVSSIRRLLEKPRDSASMQLSAQSKTSQNDDSTNLTPRKQSRESSSEIRLGVCSDEPRTVNGVSSGLRDDTRSNSIRSALPVVSENPNVHSPLPLPHEEIMVILQSLNQQVSYNTSILHSIMEILMPGENSTTLLPVFPLESTTQLLELDSALKDTKTMEALVKKIRFIGGCNVRDATRNILKTLLTTSLAVSCNWNGALGKLGLKELVHFLEALTDGVRGNPSTCTATNQEIITHARLWFKHAGDNNVARKPDFEQQ